MSLDTLMLVHDRPRKDIKFVNLNESILSHSVISLGFDTICGPTLGCPSKKDKLLVEFYWGLGTSQCRGLCTNIRNYKDEKYSLD